MSDLQQELKELESKTNKIEKDIANLNEEKNKIRQKILDLKKKVGRFHYENPQPGDFWHEMFCPIFCVLDANLDQNKITICSETKPIYELEQEDVLKSFEDTGNSEVKEKIRKVESNKYTFNIERTEVVTLQEFHERLKYQKNLLEYSVLPGRCLELANFWKKANG